VIVVTNGSELFSPEIKSRNNRQLAKSIVAGNFSQIDGIYSFMNYTGKKI